MIRTATENDIPQIRTLLESVPGFWHAEWRPEVLARALRAADGLAFVWEDGGHIAGFVCAHDVGFLGYLSALAVDRAARRKGIGRELVRHVQRELVSRGCATLIADVWRDSVGFYRKLGWSAPDAVLLRRRLGEADKQAFPTGWA